MKNEKEPNSKERLTSQADSSNLKREGDNFMAEDNFDKPPENPNEPKTDVGGGSEKEPTSPSTSSPETSPANSGSGAGGSQNTGDSATSKEVLSEMLNVIKALGEATAQQEKAGKKVEDAGTALEALTKRLDEVIEKLSHIDEEKEMRQEAARPAETAETAIPRLIEEITSSNQEAESSGGEDIKKRFNNLLSYGRVIVNAQEEGEIDLGTKNTDRAKALREIITEFDEGKIKSEKDIKNATLKLKTEVNLLDLLVSAKRKAKQPGREGLSASSYPDSLEDLVKYVMRSESAEWNETGEKELMNKEGEIQFENFMSWIREKIMFNHNNNPDGQIDLFQQIYVPTMYRQISLGEILFTDRYFRKKVASGDYRADESYKRLNREVLYEVWLFQNSHNFDAEYRSVMGVDEEAIKSLMKSYYMNIFTKNKDRLFNILTLPKLDKNEMDSAILNDTRENASSVGQAIRQELVAYYYVSEIGSLGGYEKENGNKNMFEEALGERGTEDFYRAIILKLIKDRYSDNYDYVDSKGITKNIIKELEEVNKSEKDPARRVDILDTLLQEESFGLREILLHRGYDQNYRFQSDFEATYDKYKAGQTAMGAKELARHLLGKTYIIREDQKVYVFDGKGNKVKGADGKFLQKDAPDLSELNPFTKFGKKTVLMDLTREGIRAAGAKGQELNEQDRNYAEHWANSMVYWGLISARNDTPAVGYDALSRMMNFVDYRVRQVGKSEYGDLENIYGVKKIMITPWEALRVTNQRTGAEMPLIYALQGGSGDNIDMSSPIKDVEFSDSNAQRQFAVNHLQSGFKLYNDLMREYGTDYDQFLSLDARGMLVFDEQKAAEVRKKLYKDIRYAEDFGEFFLDKDFRAWRRGADGKPIFDTKTLQEWQYNEAILNMGMYGSRRLDKRGRTLYEKDYRERTDVDGNIIAIDEDGNKRKVEKRDKNYFLPGTNTEVDEKEVKVLKHMSRNIFSYLVAMDVWKHRNLNSHARKWSMEEVSLIKEFFLTMPIEIEEDPVTHKPRITTYFYDEDQYKKIEIASSTEWGGMFWRNARYSTAEAGIGGLAKSIRTFFSVLTK